MEIRRAEPRDAPAIRAVHARAIRALAAAHYDASTIEAWAGRMTDASYAAPIATRTMLVAEDADGRLAGFGQLEPDAGVIEACYVDPAHARRGVGRRLMDALEGAARVHGRSALLLHASRNAVTFYEALGWTREADARHELEPGVTLDCAIMRKRLR